MDNQRVNRTTALAVLLATAAGHLTAAETKRETMDRRVRAAIAGFQGTVRLYARNLDTGETTASAKTKRSAPRAPSSCPSWRRSSAQSPRAARVGIKPSRFARRIRSQAQACCGRSEEHTSELQSLRHLVCRL